MRILLVGGGSGGSVAPLLAVAEEIKKTHPKARFLLVGSKSGPEKNMAAKAGMPFVAIAAGKLRRYFSLKNLVSPLLTLAGFYQAFKILKSFKPDCVFGAGSFVQVPVVWAAWFLSIPVVLHQQDIVPSLANKLCQLAAVKMTVSFRDSLKSFSSNTGLFYTKDHHKVVFTGNPFRQELKAGTKEKAAKFFNLRSDLPTLLVLGGGTGAEFINKLIQKSLPQLTKTVQVIHSTGRGKSISDKTESYHPYEFIDHMAEAYAVADIVVARAGLSTITELSNLKKVSIIIPMPETHQQDNSWHLLQNQAAIILTQNKVTSAGFVGLIRKLLFAGDVQAMLKENIGKIMPHNSAEKISEIILKSALNNEGPAI